MTFLRMPLRGHRTRLGAAMLAAGAALALAGGCASNNAPAAAGGAAAGTAGSSVEVFGVIDAGVSHSTSKSGRR